MSADRQKIRDVSYEIDMFEMKHYNEDVKGTWEKIEKTIREILDAAWECLNRDYTIEKRSEMQEDFVSALDCELFDIQNQVDHLEHVGVQNGLIRSKHLHNLLLAAKNRSYKNYENPEEIDHVQVTIPWYQERNLLENLYLKYHTTPIHKASKTLDDYYINPDDDHAGIYCFWKEQSEIFFEEEETTSNHYHDSDYEWEYDVNPTECKNLRDFFKKRIQAKNEINKQKELELVEKIKEEKKRKKELAILNAQNHKLRNYIPVEKYGKEINGSVYWFVDVKKNFTDNKHGVLYVGESKNFNNRYKAYEPKTDKLTELEKKLKKQFPEKTDAEIREFARDPEQCRLRVITRKILNVDRKRKNWESRIIGKVKPLLNRTVQRYYLR